jgi:hypothetical protein
MFTSRDFGARLVDESRAEIELDQARGSPLLVTASFAQTLWTTMIMQSTSPIPMGASLLTTSAIAVFADMRTGQCEEIQRA